MKPLTVRLALIFLFALLLRIGFAAFSKTVPSFDAAGYDKRAVSILDGHGFSEDGKPTAFKEPLYSFFLAVIYAIFGHSYLAVRIIQSILGAAICVLLVLVGKRFFDIHACLISGIILSLNPSFIKSCGFLLTETLFVFIFISVMFFSLKILENQKTINSILLGLLLGAGSLTRSTLFPFAILLCVILFFMLRGKVRFKKALQHALVIGFVFIASILPWTLRNWFVFKEFIPISNNVGINMYSSYFPPEGKIFGFTASDQNTENAIALSSESKTSSYLLNKTFEGIRKMGMRNLIRLEYLKLLFFWCPFDWEIIGGGRYNFIFGFVLPGFLIVGLYLINRIKKFLFLYFPVIYFVLISLITYGSPRFRIPVEPYIILFASYGIWAAWNRAKSRKAVGFILLSWFCVNVGVYLNSYVIRLTLARWIFY